MLQRRSKAPLHGVEKRVLHDQIFNRVTREAQLGKHSNSRRLPVASLCGIDEGDCIGGRIGYMGYGDARGNPRESLTIDGVEVIRRFPFKVLQRTTPRIHMTRQEVASRLSFSEAPYGGR